MCIVVQYNAKPSNSILTVMPIMVFGKADIFIQDKATLELKRTSVLLPDDGMELSPTPTKFRAPLLFPNSPAVKLGYVYPMQIKFFIGLQPVRSTLFELNCVYTDFYYSYGCSSIASTPVSPLTKAIYVVWSHTLPR